MFSLVFGVIQSIVAANAATTRRFQESDTIQLIDQSGELIEWDDSYFLKDAIQTQLEPIWVDQGLSTLSESSGIHDLLSPEPLEVASFWPYPKPTFVDAWTRTCESLALASDGRLFEIRSLSHTYGRPYIHPITPSVIPFPPGVVRWKSMASSWKLRLALSDAGHLWAWGSHNAGRPPNFGASTQGNNRIPAVSEVVFASCGTNLANPFEPTDSLHMYRVHAPDVGARISKVKFVLGSGLARESVSGPAHQPLYYRNPFVALLSNNELFQFGYYLGHRPEPDIWEIRRELPTKVLRPAGVSGWKDFYPVRNSIIALSTEGELYGWGHNWRGRLGNGTTNSSLFATHIQKPEGVAEWTKAQVSMFAVALGDDNQLYGWGELGSIREVVPGEADVSFNDSDYSMIKLRPTKLEIGNENDPIVDFSLSGSLVVLFESGRIANHQISLNLQHPSSLEHDLPAGISTTTINRPPFARMLSPMWISGFDGLTNLTVVAEATDVDGSLDSVKLVSNGIELGDMELVEGLRLFEWENVPKGHHKLLVRATDNQGATTDSNPVTLYAHRDRPRLSKIMRAENGGMSITVSDSDWWRRGSLEWTDTIGSGVWSRLQYIELRNSPTTIVDPEPPTGNRFYRIR